MKLEVNGLNVMGATVNCGTYDLLDVALKSVWEHYPEMPICVVDLLAKNKLDDERISQLPIGHNIGHGPGICEAMYRLRADALFIFDTDIEMTKPGFIEACIDATPREWYGVGVVKNQWGINQEIGEEFDMLYLEPYACLLNRRRFFRYARPVDHGMPMVSSCYDVCKRGNRDMLINVDVEEYIKHEGRKTFLNLGRTASYGAKERGYRMAGASIWQPGVF